MALNFADLKNNKASAFKAIQEKVEASQNSYVEDKNYWQPAVDKAGNGYAVVRFLPAPAGEDASFVKLYTHGFKGPTGKWYIENSLTTLNEKDPVAKFNSELFNSTEDDKHPNREQARKQKRRLNYIVNVLVLKDPANPQNEGKVFLFKFGKKIWDKVHNAMYPDEADKLEGKEGYNPFDFWEGADFKIKIRQVEGYKNYDNSGFADRAPLSNDDAYLESIWNQAHPLAPIVDPSQFKSYEELEKKLFEVLGRDARAAASKPSVAESIDSAPAYRPREKTASAPTPAAAASDYEANPLGGDGNDDPDLDYFRNLAQD